VDGYHAKEDAMQTRTLATLVAGALALAAGTTSAQTDRDEQAVRVAHADRWEPGAPDGFCRLRLYVDANARVELHEDQVIVRTGAGRRAYDTGSRCNQPLPVHPVRDFRVTAESGRGQLLDVVAPARDNGFTAGLTIDDPHGGGDTYELLVAWRNPAAQAAPPVALALPPVPPVALAAPTRYDDTVACQERVRRDFLARNDGTADLEVTSAPTRYDAGPVRDRLRGEGWARNANEARPMGYECLVDPRTNAVIASSYELGARRYSAR
jgi:hypothetical protein